MLRVFIPIILIVLLGQIGLQAQGAQGAMSFNGTNSYAQIPHNTLFSSHSTANGNSGELTVEAWVKVLAVATDGHGQNRQPIVVKGNAGAWEWSLYIYDDLTAGFSTWQCGGSGHAEPNGGAPLQLGRWHHVAGVFRAGVFNRVYVDGILVTQATTFGGTACVGTRPVRIASREDGQFLRAEVDEVRIWHRALDEVELREFMCQKRLGTETGLTAYYRFDEAANGSCAGGLDLCDLGPNAFHGSLFNAPQRTVSGAAIGDRSITAYPAGGWTGAMSLQLGTADELLLDQVTGTPLGMHLYEVQAAPNTICGVPGIGANDRYFGVYPVRGTNPSYALTYDYAANPFVYSGNEPFLDLATRPDNSAIICPAWANTSATLDMGLKTLSLTNLAGRRELSLTSQSYPLPLDLLRFEARVGPLGHELSWTVEPQPETAFFVLERSADAQIWQALNHQTYEPTQRDYQYLDANPLPQYSYYRLRIENQSGEFKYSPIRSLKRVGGLTLPYPNPTRDFVILPAPSRPRLSDNQGRIFDLPGRQEGQSYILDCRDLPVGVYSIWQEGQVYRLIRAF